MEKIMKTKKYLAIDYLSNDVSDETFQWLCAQEWFDACDGEGQTKLIYVEKLRLYLEECDTDYINFKVELMRLCFEAYNEGAILIMFYNKNEV
jgi:hypothetical protein